MAHFANFRLPTLVLLTVATTGCGRRSDLPKTAPVSGVLTYKQASVENAQITFHPELEGNSGRGVTDAKGRFILSTYEMKDGAVLGKHQVTVSVMVDRASPMPTRAREALSPIPIKYANKNTSTLEIEVLDKRNKVELQLED
jgi:hypothetical protein